MNKEEAKQLIIDEVTNLNGCKAIDLTVKKNLLPLVTSEFSMYELIDELVSQGRLIEIEYILPIISYRAKSFLLPAGTNVVVNNKGNNQ